MLKIGVQTKGIIEENSNIHEGFRKIKEAGFERVDFNLDAFLMNSDVYAGKINRFFDQELSEVLPYFEKYREAMESNGLRPSQMHAPYPVRVVAKPQVTQYMQGTVIPKSLFIGEALGVPWMVLHPFKLQYTHGKRQEILENMEYFKALIPLIRQSGVRVCMENLYESVGGRIVEGVCADPDDAIHYIDTLNETAGEELFGFCLDTGHLQLVKRDPYEFIKKLGSRIKILHIHENDGIGDLHQIPFTFGAKGERGADWEGVFRGLKEIGFDGTLSFETFPCMNSFPPSCEETLLKTIHEIGVYMAEEIERQ